MGSGSGRFAHHLLRALAAIAPDAPFKVVLSDFSQSTVDSWLRHPTLRSWVDRGRLDFACFDPLVQRSLRLIDSGETLAPGTVANSLAVVGNYFFDSLPQDIFEIVDGRLFECPVSLELTTAGPVPNLDDVAVLRRLEARFDRAPVEGDAYPDPAWNRLLHYYQAVLGPASTHLSFPVGALQCLDTLWPLAGAGLLLLAADRGYHRLQDLSGRGQPAIARHGSVSMLVNFHAIGEYCQTHGAEFLSTDRSHAKLDICAALSGRANHGGAQRHTCRAFEAAIGEFGPGDFFTLKKAIERSYDNLSVAEILAHLRFSRWDSSIFLGAFPSLARQLDDVSDALGEQLLSATRSVWENYYPLEEDDDLPFLLGIICFGINSFAEAIVFFRHSLRLHGPDAATLCNLALSHARLGEPGRAEDWARQALAADASFEPAQSLLAEFALAHPASPV